MSEVWTLFLIAVLAGAGIEIGFAIVRVAGAFVREILAERRKQRVEAWKKLRDESRRAREGQER